MVLYERPQVANPLPPPVNKSLWRGKRRSSVYAIPNIITRPESRTEDAYEIASEAAQNLTTSSNKSRLPLRAPLASSSPSSWNLATKSGERPAFLDEPIPEENRMPRSHSRVKSLGGSVANVIPSWLNVVKGSHVGVRKDSVEEEREGRIATTPGKKRFPSFKVGGKGRSNTEVEIVPPTPTRSESAFFYSTQARSSTSLSTDVHTTESTIPVPHRSLHDYQLTPKSSTASTSTSSHFRFPSTLSSSTDSAGSRSNSPSSYGGIENDTIVPEFGAKKENWRAVFGQKMAGGDGRRRLSSIVSFGGGGGGGGDARDRMSSIVSSNEGDSECINIPTSESTYFIEPSTLISQMKTYNRTAPIVRRVPPPRPSDSDDYLAPLSPAPRNLRTPKKSPSSRSFLNSAPPSAPSALFVDSMEAPRRRVS